MTLQTEFEFELPRGFIDADGTLHRLGSMRLATGLDEIAPLDDPRARQNEAYVVIILLSRVITRLGSLPQVTPQIVEQLFTTDIAFLQDLYRQINALDDRAIDVVCPQCGHQFEEFVPFLGES